MNNFPINSNKNICISSKKFWCFFCYFRIINICPNLKLLKLSEKIKNLLKNF